MTTAELNITEEQLQRFQDVKGWLTYLYDECMRERGLKALSKHTKSDKTAIADRLKALEEYRLTLNPAELMNQINQWHTMMIVYVLMFQEKRWTDIVYEELPKLPTVILVELMKNSMFDDPVTTYKLTTKERSVLRDFALRLS